MKQDLKLLVLVGKLAPIFDLELLDALLYLLSMAFDL